MRSLCPVQPEGQEVGESLPAEVCSPDDLCELLGIPFSDQQLAAITAPLEPGVIVAGAGSGKTTVMAARVVWLVGTGAGPPGAGAGPHLHQEGGRRAGRPDPRRPLHAAAAGVR